MVIKTHGCLYEKPFECSVCGCVFVLEPHDVGQIICPPFIQYEAKDLMAAYPECGHGATQKKV